MRQKSVGSKAAADQTVRDIRRQTRRHHSAEEKIRIVLAGLREDQILVYQVPQPEPLTFLEPRKEESRKIHAYAEYGVMHLKLYEDVARFGRIASTYSYPVMVGGRYLMSPSPIPKFDNPKMDGMAALQLFGAGREKRIYAVPPYTEVRSLDFDDHPFDIETWDEACALCGTDNTYLDEVILDDQGGKMFVCSDSDWCRGRRETGHTGAMSDDTRAAVIGGAADAATSGDVGDTP